MNILDQIIEYIGEYSATDIVDNVNEQLFQFEKDNVINAEERDALRHYFGMRALSNKFGETPAWIMGIINEGMDVFMPGEAGMQSQIDRQNNLIALQHLEEGVGFNIEDVKSKDDLMSILFALKITPPVGFEETLSNKSATIDSMKNVAESGRDIIEGKNTKAESTFSDILKSIVKPRRKDYNLGYHPNVNLDE